MTEATSHALPPALRPGDVVAVIAPSSPFDATLVWRGLGFLAQRYRVRFTRGLFARDGYLAGDDDRRARELSDALEDSEVRAIFAARGGFGANRIAHRVEWSKLAEDPKWIVGFSDITALHVEASRVAVASIHGCHVTALGRSSAATRDGLLSLLEAPGLTRTLRAGRALCPGEARGPLYGGNLAVLHACATAGRLRVPEGSVLLLEDVGERPYRIDRMLCTLLGGGHLDGVAAVAAGEFEGCGPGPDGITVEQVLTRAFAPRDVPVVVDLPVGHGLRNQPVVLGQDVQVHAEDAAPRLVLADGSGLP